MSNSFDILRKELQRWPEVTYSVDRTTRHPRIWLEYRGMKKFIPFSSTPVGKYGLMQKVTQLRRTLRELGAERE